MPPKQTEIELSDDDFDEIISDDEDAKPNKNDPVAVLRGSLTKPRHTQTSTKHLHGESSNFRRKSIGSTKGLRKWVVVRGEDARYV
jgi:hypothetical protein